MIQARMRYLGPLVVTMAIALCAFLIISRIPPPLVEEAHIVRPSTGMNSAHSYLWLNDHTLFLYEEQSKAFWPMDASYETRPGSQHPIFRRIDIVDTQTGRQRSIVCPPVPLQLPQWAGIYDYYPTLQFFVSPDLKHLLALSDFGYSVVPAASVDQGQSAFALPWRQWPISRPTRPGVFFGGCLITMPLQYPGDQVLGEDANHATWLSDGSWITMHHDNNSELIFRTAGKDGPEMASHAISLLTLVNHEDYAMLRAIGARADGNMVVLACPVIVNAANRTAYLLEFDPKAPSTISDKTVLLPQLDGPPQILDAALSPEGDRIAWLLPEYEKPLTRVQYWLLRFHLISPGLGPDTALWISDRHGRNLHRVKEWHTGSAQLSSLQWCPDGSKVSFETMSNFPNGTETEFKIDTIAIGH